VDKSLPAGYSPQAFVQAFTFDGKGSGTGWISANLGGVQFSAPVKWTYAMQADCSVQATHSFEISGVWTAPASVLWVVGGMPDDFELKGIVLGTGPARRCLKLSRVGFRRRCSPAWQSSERAEILGGKHSSFLDPDGRAASPP
jgi:hypothetical protein